MATQNAPHQRLAAGAAKLGYSYRVATLNIDPDKYDPNLIGYSGMGDQTGAKQGTMRTYLQDASDAGAKLLPNTCAERILTENGAAVGVEATYTDPQTQQTSRVVIHASSVVAAAGAWRPRRFSSGRVSAGPPSAPNCDCIPPASSPASTTNPRTRGTGPRWPAS